MAKEYKVKLAQGFNAAGRRRAGLNLIKGETLVTELTAEQLSELQADVWVVVQDANAADTTDGSEGGQVDPHEGVSFKDLKAQAVEAGIDVKGMKSRADVIAALDAAAAGSEGGEDEEETLELSEDMTLEDLKAVAVDQGVAPEVVEAATDETKADLIKAIEEAAAKTEE